MNDMLKKLMPPNYSVHGRELDHLNLMVHWLMLILFVAWGLLFIYMLWRFRASRNPKAVYHGTHSHLSTYAEAGVALVEVVLLVAFSIPAWYAWRSAPARSANPLEVRVVGEQFAWNVHYPGADGIFGRTDAKLVSSTNPLGLDPADNFGKDDLATLNQLHIEVNRPTIVRISSKDVIHSFYLPVMRVKQDAVPGMETPVHFTPTRTNQGDKWEIGCAQLCGLGHYRMKGMLFVDSKADFQKFLSTTPPALSQL